MKVTFPNWRCFEYNEVFRITEFKDGCVYKTQRVGFCHQSRPKKDGEVYSSLSTSITKEKEITLDLLDN